MKTDTNATPSNDDTTNPDLSAEEESLRNEDEEVRYEDLTPEEREAAEKEAEEGFASGFKKIAKSQVRQPNQSDKDGEEDDDDEADKAAAEAKAAEEAKAETKRKEDEAKQQAEAPARKEEEFNKRIRTLEGRIGDLTDKLDKQATPAKTDEQAPSQEEVEAALSDPDKMKELIEEYPDFEPMAQELSAIRKEISGLKKGGGSEEDVIKVKEDLSRQFQAEMQMFKEESRIATKHPDWEQTLQSEEFRDWSLKGGPSNEEYAAMNGQPNTQAGEAKAQEMINKWARDYSDWWADRGVFMFSSKADDAIKIIDKYVDTSKAQEAERQKAEKQAKNKKRLESNLTPKGQGGDPNPGVSDEAAFEKGFKKVNSGRLTLNRI